MIILANFLWDKMGESVIFCSFKKYVILSMPIDHLTPKNM
ncbi:hypothetical protein AO368_0581 [Moraxella catarrhalis]|nr:hypothetical protein AO368_0581 [Moraxella catarrhalis]